MSRGRTAKLAARAAAAAGLALSLRVWAENPGEGWALAATLGGAVVAFTLAAAAGQGARRRGAPVMIRVRGSRHGREREKIEARRRALGE